LLRRQRANDLRSILRRAALCLSARGATPAKKNLLDKTPIARQSFARNKKCGLRTANVTTGETLVHV